MNQSEAIVMAVGIENVELRELDFNASINCLIQSDISIYSVLIESIDIFQYN